MHRRLYMTLVGEVKAKEQVHHRCENKPCCNPDHLEPLLPLDHAKLTNFPKREWVECPKGHAFSEENTIIRKDGRRRCRTCFNAAKMESYYRAKAEGTIADKGQHNSRKTHCPQGHEYNEENTGYTRSNSRFCRTCSRERQTVYNHKVRGKPRR